MGVFEMVVLIVFISTAGKVAHGWAVRRTSAPIERRVRELEAMVAAGEERLAHTEERVMELSEKLGFVENLLASPDRPTGLPRPGP